MCCSSPSRPAQRRAIYISHITSTHAQCTVHTVLAVDTVEFIRNRNPANQPVLRAGLVAREHVQPRRSPDRAELFIYITDHEHTRTVHTVLAFDIVELILPTRGGLASSTCCSSPLAPAALFLISRITSTHAQYTQSWRLCVFVYIHIHMHVLMVFVQV